jgi:basic membrane protein A
LVPQAIRDLVADKKAKILSGEWDVFNGPIYNQKGEVVVPKGQVMSDIDKLNMGFFVKGVVGKVQ